MMHYYRGAAAASKAAAAQGGGGGSAFFTKAMALSPILYWRLNEASGPTAADESGTGNTGTYNGTIGYEAGGLLADDADEGIEIDPKGAGYVVGSDLGTTVQAVTCMFTFSGSDGSDNEIMSILPDGGTRFEFLIQVRDRTNKIRAVDEDGDIMSADNTVSASTDPHIVTVFYDSGSNTTKMLIDGVLQAETGAGNMMAEAAPVIWLAASQFSGSVVARWWGKLDELLVYSSGHSQADWEELHSLALGD